MKSCRVVHPGRRLGPVRLGGVGLGNLLFPWARAMVYARSQGIPVEWPVWSQIFVEAWKHRDADKRFYGTLFRRTADYAPSPWYWETRVPPFSWLREKPVRKFTEQESAAFEACTEPAVLCFSELAEFWGDLIGHDAFLWEELTRIARVDMKKAQARGRGTIGVHIRRGDFVRHGWATPIEWYAEKIFAIRRRTNKPIVVFCDDGPQPVAALLAMPGVSFSETGHHVLLDIAHMAGLDGIIYGNGSTFAGWAVYFGRMPVIARATKWWPPGYWATFSRFAVEHFAPGIPSEEEYDGFVEHAHKQTYA